MKGGVNAGLVYYAQWKVTSDSGSDLPRILQLAGLQNSKNKAYALGPEVRVVIPKIEGQLTFRYYKEFGNRTVTEGHTFVAAITFFLHRPFAQMRKQQPAPAEPKP